MNKGMKHKRSIIFAAYPSFSGQLRTIFSSTDDSIRKRLENPPIIREEGWDLRTFDRARTIDRTMIRVKHRDENKDRKIIDLYQDGTLILAALADHNFLGSGYRPGEPWLNPTAIVELVYNFVDFYKLVLEDFREKPKEISIRIELRNMHLKGEKTYLPHFTKACSGKYAPFNNDTIVRNFKTDNFAIGIIAFEILKEIYAWFGWDEENIPLTKTEGNRTLIDSEAIINLK
jgi:hypothetical protein